MTAAPPTPPDVLLDADALGAHARALGSRIAADHPDGVVLVGILKGALVFLADLAREVRGIDVAVDFLAISRYAPDSGRVRILRDLDIDVSDRDVVLVEDLVDTGLSLAYLLEHVRARGARHVDVCALLDRSSRRIVPLPLRYVGEELPGDAFVLGYGLHHQERYRNLPMVVEAEPSLLADDPDAFLGLYARLDTPGPEDGR